VISIIMKGAGSGMDRVLEPELSDVRVVVHQANPKVVFLDVA